MLVVATGTDQVNCRKETGNVAEGHGLTKLTMTVSQKVYREI
jgi:hypothetical protein